MSYAATVAAAFTLFFDPAVAAGAGVAGLAAVWWSQYAAGGLANAGASNPQQLRPESAQ